MYMHVMHNASYLNGNDVCEFILTRQIAGKSCQRLPEDLAALVLCRELLHSFYELYKVVLSNILQSPGSQ